MSKAPGVLLYNIVNRGNHGGPDVWHVGGDPGDGFLYRMGHMILWSGWQGDMPITFVNPNQEGIDLPIAQNAHGSPGTSRVLVRIANLTQRHTTESIPGAAGRKPASLDTKGASLVSATSETPSGVKTGMTSIGASDWAFADCRTTPFPGTPDPSRVCAKNGF